MKDKEFAKQYVATLSDEELCGEVLSWQFSKSTTEEELLEAVKKNKISSFFANTLPIDKIEFLKNAVKHNSKSPCLITADIERGPIYYDELKGYATSMMSLGAVDDEALAFEIGKYTARLSRALDLHLALSPVVDINLNPLNPVTNTRAVSDDAERVIRIAGAYGKGMRSEGNLATAVKHFPGDGVDDKNQHFCTTVNSISKEEWMNTYGKVYKKMIEDGTEAIMVAHIALPWFDPTIDECGHMPATLSKKLMTDLLKGELGFDGCIISDAMSMIGTAARMPLEDLSVEFLRAGGDLVLFPEKDDHERILKALSSGLLGRSRLIDAAERVVALKHRLGLFCGNGYILNNNDIEETKALLTNAAQRSISLLRDYSKILPLDLKKGARVMVVTLAPGETDGNDCFPHFANALEKQGFETVRLTNPTHYKINELVDTVDAVFVNSIIDTTNGTGNSLRLSWNNMKTFWRGYLFKNKNLVFTSFGDPYKLMELPFLKTYINAYIASDAAATAVVQACLGFASLEGKNPVIIPSVCNTNESSF